MKESKKIWKMVSDLGASAFIRLHGFKTIGRKGKNFYFEIEENQENEFNQLAIDYTNSPMHDFDSCLMSLKKLPEYLPEKQP
jgi:hypothetical protein